MTMAVLVCKSNPTPVEAGEEESEHASEGGDDQSAELMEAGETPQATAEPEPDIARARARARA